MTTTATFAIRVQPAPVQAPVLDSPAMLPGNVFRLRVTGVSGLSYTLQSSATLTSWSDVLTTNAPANVFELRDVKATESARMYRLKVNN